MTLDEALYELTGAGLVACAAGLGLDVPSGAVLAGDAFVGFLSQRGSWGEINRLVEELKRDLLRDADVTMTTPADIVAHVREAVVLLEDVRPDVALLQAALMPSNGDPGSPQAPPLIAPATRIAAQMIARASSLQPLEPRTATASNPSMGPSHGAQALLHRLMATLLREPYLIVGLGSALQEFVGVTSPPRSAPVPAPRDATAVKASAVAALPPAMLPAPMPSVPTPLPSAGSAAMWPASTEPVATSPTRLAALHNQGALPAPAVPASVPVPIPAPGLRDLVDRHGLGEAFARGLVSVAVVETLERLRAAHQLSDGAYGRFLRTLESQDCPPGAAPLRLDEMATWLAGLVAALTKPSNDDGDTRRQKSEAAKALLAGDIETAVQRLKQVRRGVREGRRRIEERLREDLLLLNQQMAEEAGVIARQAEMELTRRDYASAAELFAEARDSLPRGEMQAAWLYAMRQGEALFRLGDEFDDGQALREAVRAYRGCLAMTAREEMPRNWVAAQCGLALALQRQAERETDAEPLQTAIEAWRAALDALETMDEPGQTLVSRRHLARALVAAGERDKDAAVATARLHEACALFKTLIQVAPRDRSPFDWAESQMGLAMTLLTLDERSETGSGDGGLAEAVAALRSALTVYDRDRNPSEWAQARVSMGHALLAMGERARDLDRLAEAVSCFQDALDTHSRHVSPRLWAQIATGLANALAAVGEQARDAEHLEAAVRTYREALEELHGEDDAMRRAIAQLNLGTVLVRLAGYRDSHRHRLEAMSVMMSALEVFEARRAAAYVRIAEINLRNLHKLMAGGAAPGQARAS